MSYTSATADPATLNIWRGQSLPLALSAACERSYSTTATSCCRAFAEMYRRVRLLPRRLRKALQRRWGVSLAATGVAADDTAL